MITETLSSYKMHSTSGSKVFQRGVKLRKEHHVFQGSMLPKSLGEKYRQFEGDHHSVSRATVDARRRDPHRSETNGIIEELSDE